MAASTHLAVLGEASRLLAEATSLDEVKAFRDKAEAARNYIKAARMGLEVQNRAAEAKLRAERKAGQLLSAMKLRGGNRKSKSCDTTLKLDSLGISRDQSAHWQRMAAVPEADFRAYLQSMNDHGREITSIGFLRTSGKKCSRTKRPSDLVVSTNGHVKNEGPEEAFAELADHCRLLHEILKPSPQAARSELTPSDRRIADRLVTENCRTGRSNPKIHSTHDLSGLRPVSSLIQVREHWSWLRPRPSPAATDPYHLLSLGNLSPGLGR